MGALIIFIPVLFMGYLVLSLTNNCIHKDGHTWDVCYSDTSKYRCRKCNKKRNKTLTKIWSR